MSNHYNLYIIYMCIPTFANASFHSIPCLCWKNKLFLCLKDITRKLLQWEAVTFLGHLHVQLQTQGVHELRTNLSWVSLDDGVWSGRRVRSREVVDFDRFKRSLKVPLSIHWMHFGLIEFLKAHTTTVLLLTLNAQEEERAASMQT